ncbi:LacI family DNA-binding transcriptional regulator [Paenibacillus planticolens]|uniref:LacI family DNA-binding transcriptional regulator n=1 Tax=Paenibacillus planticolens TaxID=2654976 RepID=A0ABX1ZWJ0_9BACL|nr:substrate-binding domain-containing protein [Paenibacillus planticolens]NOV03322.1 LacI family DNA-binding transcriptional regulator [Paenibacillus planticolens]
MKVSIFDVAKKSGLSVVTVSRVINGAGTVRENNRQRVLQAMKELDYHPNAAARSLARGKTGVIGLAITTLNDTFFDAVVKEINERLAESGYFLALSISNDVFSSFENSLFQEDRVDGMMMLSPTNEEAYVKELQRKKMPFVLMDNQHMDKAVSSVIVDNFKGGYEATKHLIELGHTEIAHIRGPEPFMSSRERQRGYCQAMKDAGISDLWIEQGQFAVASGYEIAERWLQAGKKPTAVFAADDYVAFGIIDAFKNNGLQIPKDLSVVGYDDQIFAAEFRPKLTTVRQPSEKLGKAAVDELLRLIDGTAEGHQTVVLEPEIVVRETTARINS